MVLVNSRAAEAAKEVTYEREARSGEPVERSFVKAAMVVQFLAASISCKKWKN